MLKSKQHVPRAGALLFVVSLMLLAVWIGPQLTRDISAAAPSPPPLAGAGRPIDGDTFAIGAAQIRLWGIDAPEADTRLGREATRLMARVLAQDTPVVMLDEQWEVVGCFIERPRALREFLAQDGEGSQFARKMAWYDTDAGHATVTEIVELLEGAAAGAPRCE